MGKMLRNHYPGVATKAGNSCGGNQNWLLDPVMQRCGCGVVAALDLVRYLHLYHENCKTTFFTGIPESVVLPQPLYDLCAQRMRRAYIPVLPPIGTSGIALTAGLNHFFRYYRLPLAAAWGTKQMLLWSDISDMLEEDLPVILSIGKPFKRFWLNEKLLLHRRTEDGIFQAARECSGHFVTVIGQDETWLQVSSWGKIYYINRQEFLQYSRTQSAVLACNILHLSRQV